MPNESHQEGKRRSEESPLRSILFAATVPARKSTQKDLDDVTVHESDPIERKDHRAMDNAVADLCSVA
ncbi:MAG TPA: hypothetical protein VGW39_11760 [Chthoniobacterales bacterium]|nr:hypothetical protein [Chthoniobacterales bacterium]